MGFLDNLQYLGEIFKEAGTTFKEAGQEFGELMTDGFKEMIIKNNVNYKTSFEKKEIANRKVYIAGSEYEGAKNNYLNRLKETNAILTEFNQYKVDLYQGIISDWKKAVIPYKKEISQHRLPWIDNLQSKYGEMNLVNLSNYIEELRIALKSPEPANEIFDIQSIFWGNRDYLPFTLQTPNSTNLSNLVSFLNEQRERVENVNAYLNDAEDFKSKVGYAVENIEQEKTKLDLIIGKVNEAKFLIKDAEICLRRQFEELYSKLINLDSVSGVRMDLISSYKTESFSQGELNALAIADGLVDFIVSISQAPIINEQGQVSEAFSELYSGINMALSYIKSF